MKQTWTLLVLVSMMLTGPVSSLATERDDLSPGWGESVALFDGRTLNGWTDGDGNPISEGWEARDGELVRVERGGAIYPEVEFEDFVLDFEWKIAPKGNSGVKYRVKYYERGVRGNPGWLGCEYQLYDDAGRNVAPKSSAGALYALFGPNEKKNLHPAGEYNQSRIVVSGNKIAHWLNGEKIVDVDTSSDAWSAAVADSKFAPAEGFGQNRRGRIQFQDHGAGVSFRNITIRRPESAE